MNFTTISSVVVALISYFMGLAIGYYLGRSSALVDQVNKSMKELENDRSQTSRNQG